VDEEQAAKARRHAMELALAEQALMEKYGSMVSDWIDEGFDKKGIDGNA
jgi:NAD(P)H-hydrate repair Nnr-like enzyme with NAD(P)H-hydrate epimerase domain